jgi:hypothetical protein
MYVCAYMQVPRLQDVLKNLIAVISTRPTDEVLTPGKQITPTIALLCAKKVLKGIQSYGFPSHVQWGLDHPQSDNETSIEFLDRLSKYKVIRKLIDRVREKGGKMSVLFGKAICVQTRCWPAIQDDILKENANAPLPRKVDEEILAYFLKTFEASFVAESGRLEDMDDAKLIWSANFYEELRERQRRRTEAIANRSKESESKCTEIGDADDDDGGDSNKEKHANTEDSEVNEIEEVS